jgi:predicted nucleic acid-binding protein
VTAALPNLESRLKNCRGVLIDSNILLDVALNDPHWADWSERALAECADRTTLVIVPLVYAEVSVGFKTIEALDAALPAALYSREALAWEAAFLAGKCFVAYRRKGGIRNSPLPDFYIGAHAAVTGLAVLTRDAARYRTYFPKLEVFAPPANPI